MIETHEAIVDETGSIRLLTEIHFLFPAVYNKINSKKRTNE